MKHIFILFTFFYVSLQAAAPVDSNTTQKDSEANLTKIHIPTHYKDYTWDVGIISGLTMDGTQTDSKRFTMGSGLHVGYHLNESVSFHGEIVHYYKTFTPVDYNDAVTSSTSTVYAANVQYDFSAERTYSLYAKAGLGYEKLNLYHEDQTHPISLLGFGFRYMFTERISGYVEGRWRMRLTNMSEPDNGLVGTIGLDYHFGLDDEKAKLIDEADKHNAWIDKRLAAIAKEQERQAELKANSSSK